MSPFPVQVPSRADLILPPQKKNPTKTTTRERKDLGRVQKEGVLREGGCLLSVMEEQRAAPRSMLRFIICPIYLSATRLGLRRDNEERIVH